MEQILLKEKIEIPPTPEAPGADGNGVFAFIYRGAQIEEIQSVWGRKGCCLKVFKNRNNQPFREDLDRQVWGPHPFEIGSYLKKATFVQNLYALYGLAPRVYAIFILIINGNKHWAQLTDDLGHWKRVSYKEQDELIKGPMADLAKKYKIKTFNDGRIWNVIANKYIDFQGFYPDSDYKEGLKKRLFGVAKIGKWGPFQNYQSIPELAIKGGRDTEHRIKNIGFDQIDFRGKTVLDVGCSEGIFCHYAAKRGAKKVVGIDLTDVILPVAEWTYYLSYYNIDFKGYNLKEESPEELGQFDITFFLSMGFHIKFPDWIDKMTKELLIFEGNARNEDTLCEKRIKETFRLTEKKGETKDLFDRPVIWGIR